jgi:hypothetical protein
MIVIYDYCSISVAETKTVESSLVPDELLLSSFTWMLQMSVTCVLTVAGRSVTVPPVMVIIWRQPKENNGRH